MNAGTALCYCPNGYQGNYCEIMIDNCKSSPCYHGGTCKNLPNNFSCSCTPYYDGYKCDNGIFFILIYLKTFFINSYFHSAIISTRAGATHCANNRYNYRMCHFTFLVYARLTMESILGEN